MWKLEVVVGVEARVCAIGAECKMNSGKIQPGDNMRW